MGLRPSPQVPRICTPLSKHTDKYLAPSSETRNPNPTAANLSHFSSFASGSSMSNPELPDSRRSWTREPIGSGPMGPGPMGPGGPMGSGGPMGGPFGGPGGPMGGPMGGPGGMGPRGMGIGPGKIIRQKPIFVDHVYHK